MSNCQYYVEMHLPRIKEAIRLTEDDDHEHAFAFSHDDSTDVILGDCNNVPRPTMPNMIGTLHTHTLDYTKYSEQDIDTFKKTDDKLLCLAYPSEGVWNARCLDRQLAVCGSVELPKGGL